MRLISMVRGEDELPYKFPMTLKVNALALEFVRVILASANAEVIPLSVAKKGAEDEVARRKIEMQERSLLHVALTRARRSALVTGFGEISPFLEGATVVEGEVQ